VNAVAEVMSPSPTIFSGFSVMSGGIAIILWFCSSVVPVLTKFSSLCFSWNFSNGFVIFTCIWSVSSLMFCA